MKQEVKVESREKKKIKSRVQKLEYNFEKKNENMFRIKIQACSYIQNSTIVFICFFVFFFFQ